MTTHQTSAAEELLPVEQCDREAAADIGALLGWSGTICFDVRMGTCEAIRHEYPEQVAVIERIARHRLAAATPSLETIARALARLRREEHAWDAYMVDARAVAAALAEGKPQP